jgi:hypothetical protein
MRDRLPAAAARRRTLASVSRAALIAACALLAGCGGGGQSTPKAKPKPAPGPAAAAAKPRATATAPRWPPPARCPRSAGNCTAARGTVLYVERVDPDGDGDAHLVLASAQGVSAPGITAIDVERALRPHPLPRVGDRVSAAGPVYRGSHGQRQIQATELHVARDRHRDRPPRRSG